MAPPANALRRTRLQQLVPVALLVFTLVAGCTADGAGRALAPSATTTQRRTDRSYPPTEFPASSRASVATVSMPPGMEVWSDVPSVAQLTGRAFTVDPAASATSAGMDGITIAFTDGELLIAAPCGDVVAAFTITPDGRMHLDAADGGPCADAATARTGPFALLSSGPGIKIELSGDGVTSARLLIADGAGDSMVLVENPLFRGGWTPPSSAAHKGRVAFATVRVLRPTVLSIRCPSTGCNQMDKTTPDGMVHVR